MIIIGESGNLATVGATSNALRTTLYDPQGREIVEVPSTTAFRSYIGGFNILHAGATATATIMVALANPSKTDYIRVRSFRSIIGFNGTAPGASTRSHAWTRAVGQPAGSNTVITPTKKRSGDIASVADMQTNNAGMGTTAPATNGDNAWVQTVSVAVTSNLQFYSWPAQTELASNSSPVELRFNQALILVCKGTAIQGLGTSGYIEWDEGTL